MIKENPKENPSMEKSKDIKNPKFEIDKKKEAISSLAMIVAAGALGYFLFVQEPLAAKNAYASDLNSKEVSSDHELATDGSVNTSKENYDEEEVYGAVSDYISSDPNVRVTSQSFEEGEDDLGILVLEVGHHGLAGELSQYIETLNSASKSIVVDNINYSETLDGTVDTQIKLSIPYKKGDGTLASMSFVTEDSTVLADATNSDSSSSGNSSSTTSKWTKPTPATSSSTSTKSSSSSSSKSTSKKTSTSSSYTRPKSSGSSSSTTKPNPPKVTVTDQNDPKIGQGQVVESPTAGSGVTTSDSSAFTSPVMTPDTDHFAPAFVNYSMIENIEEIKFPGGEKDVHVNREDIKNDDMKEAAVKLTITSAMDTTLATDLNRQLQINLKPYYLAKNAQTIAFTLNSEATDKGEFTLTLEDGSGNEIKLGDPKVEELDQGLRKIIFKLENMDGRVKVKSLDYNFEIKENLNEEIMLKNIEISSIPQK